MIFKIFITLLIVTFALAITLGMIYRGEEKPERTTMLLGTLALSLPVVGTIAAIEAVWF